MNRKDADYRLNMIENLLSRGMRVAALGCVKNLRRDLYPVDRRKRKSRAKAPA